MVDNGSSDGSKRSTGVSRRRFVQATGASGVAFSLAGCAGGGGGDGGGGGGGGGGTPSGKVQFAADSRFADNIDKINQILHEDGGLPDSITVEALAGSQVTDNRQSQYNQWLSANRSKPSLLMMDSGWTIPFIARGQVANLSDEIPDVASLVKDEYFQASVQTAQDSEGNLYGVPLFPDFPTMQYNKKYLREAGYGESDFKKWATESMRWKEFSKITKEAKEAAGVKYGYTFQADVYEGLSCCDFNEFMTSWGGAYFGNPKENLFGPVGKRPITVDEQQVINSIKMVRSFIHGPDASNAHPDYAGPIAPEAVLQWTEETSRKPFTNGDAVMHRNWPYSININGASDVFGKDLGVMPIPYAKSADEAKYPMTGGPVAALGGWHATLNPNAANKEAALEVIKAFTKESVQLKMFGLIGWIPPRPSLLTSKEAKNVDVIGRYVEQLKVAGENAIPRPVTVVWPQESDKIAQEVNAAYSGDKTPTKAMSDLKSSLKQIENSA